MTTSSVPQSTISISPLHTLQSIVLHPLSPGCNMGVDFVVNVKQSESRYVCNWPITGLKKTTRSPFTCGCWESDVWIRPSSGLKIIQATMTYMCNATVHSACCCCIVFKVCRNYTQGVKNKQQMKQKCKFTWLKIIKHKYIYRHYAENSKPYYYSLLSLKKIWIKALN